MFDNVNFRKTAQKCYCGSSNCRGVIGVEAEGRKQSEDKEAKDQSDDYSSCSDDTSSSDDSDLEIEPAIEPVVCTKSSKLKNADQVEDVKPVKSSELNEKWKNSVLKNYRIPKKAPVSIVKIECNDSVEYSQSPQLNHSNTSSSQNSELPAPTRRRKSRFEPIVVQKPSIELTSLTPPKLIQIPTSNASCSNTCSSSSTPSNPDNNGSSTTTTNNNGTVDSFVNSYPQQVKQGNRAKPTQRAYHAFAGNWFYFKKTFNFFYLRYQSRSEFCAKHFAAAILAAFASAIFYVNTCNATSLFWYDFGKFCKRK